MPIGKVLVVDDEPIVVECVSFFLKSAGYEPLCASGARQALDILVADGPVALVLSDVRMPGMSGPELVSEIRRLAPNTPAILMSGYPGSDCCPEVPFLQKPFKAAELLAKVGAVLGNCSPAGNAEPAV